jgi:hypothetical protein
VDGIDPGRLHHLTDLDRFLQHIALFLPREERIVEVDRIDLDLEMEIVPHLRAHRAITSDEVGEDREHRRAGGALDTPEGDTRKPDTHRRRMAGQTPSPTTARLVLQLKANGHDEGHDTGEKRLAVAKHW